MFVKGEVRQYTSTGVRCPAILRVSSPVQYRENPEVSDAYKLTFFTTSITYVGYK